MDRLIATARIEYRAHDCIEHLSTSNRLFRGKKRTGLPLVNVFEGAGPLCWFYRRRDRACARFERDSGAMTTSRIANIVAWDNGAGLARDIDLLSVTLRELGWDLRFNGRRTRPTSGGLMRRVFRRFRKDAAIATAALTRRPPFAVNLFLEDISPEFLRLGARNVLIPNAECFRPASAPFLGQMDAVFAKTQDALDRFRELGSTVEFMGFLSADRRLVSPAAVQVTEAIHIAGRSMLKGTESVLDVWTRRPDWPQLTVVRSRTDYSGARLPWRIREECSNVTIVEDRLTEQALRLLQNEKRLHIATSESEGFGHSIVEAMSVGAVVITTDAPPMNELVTKACGFLVRTSNRTAIGLGWRYTLSEADLERQIELALSADTVTLDKMGAEARRRYQEMVERFPASLSRCLASVCRL